ncbi:MAG: choice-of-anchor J domain-containing protein [Cyclobacteriaceae bacterium]|nr:choice-of-anchor J domain-containing protein [Cyclobacteriaceae bacterium]
MRLQIVFISALLISAYSNTHAQDRCGTVQYEELRHQKNPNLEKSQQFENWLNNKISQPKLQQQRTEGTEAATYVIPVVVHIIHNGEGIGTGLNLSDAQIQSQINVMNKDFQRMNLDAVNTPSEFIPVAGNLDIEFVLAKQDPFGAATNGIQRVQGTKSVWTINDNATFKALSYWPAENYYNIWVINIPSYLGYAQSPVSNLPGLENSPDDRLTDGVIVHYTAFGSNFEGLGTFNLDTKYNRGRTATHETGHFFGLRHIWGDDGSSCSGTDYVNDTPNQGGSYSGQCPSGTRTSCNTSDMYMNYMDYTDDACMNIFSQGQNARMIVVLENSPRRFSLLNSIGDEPPPPLTLDLALRKVISPGSTSCGGSIIPILEIQNLGTTTLTSVRIQLKKNGTITETKDFVLNLSFEGITTVPFSSILQAAGLATFEFEVLLVNNAGDQRATNDKLSMSTSVPPTGNLPISEIFNTIPSDWSRYNPDNNFGWELISTPGHGNTMYVNCYDYENEGAIDRLITPIFDLTSAPVAFLSFDRAHAFYGASNQERLRVLVTTVCDFNAPATEIFNLSGTALATAPQTTNNFVPTSSQWQTTALSLDAFIGNKIQIAFEVVNGWGNNVYLDNVVVSTDQLIDLALLSVESPGPVTCVANPTPQVLLKNLGSVAITSFTIQATINNQSQPTQTISNISFGAGEEKIFNLNAIPLLSGNNAILYTISNPNGLPDANSLNNTLSINRIVNTYAERIPLRENFNQPFTNKWSVISPNNLATWVSVVTNKENSLGYIGFTNPNKGEESWLVSPVLDFSNTSKASLFFDVSYASQSQGNEKLRILYSADCGQTFNNTLYDQSGSSLSTGTTSQFWKPSSNDEWRREFINLNSLTGSDQLRFAFVATNDNGNNLYVDNIEYFIDDDPFPILLQNPYSVYGGGNELKLTFNLEEKQTTYLKIYTLQGQILVDNVLPETLNQTYSFDLGIQGSGIYIVQVISKEGANATKVFLSGK